MNFYALLGALETGLIFGFVALGTYITFRLLKFPDITVEGSFPLGGAVAAASIVAGANPYLATLLAFVAGMLAGSLTAFLNVRLRILHILSGILASVAMYSINMRIMGRPNTPLLGTDTVFTGLGTHFAGSAYACRSCSSSCARRSCCCSTASSLPRPGWPCGRPAPIRAWRRPTASTPAA